MSVANQIGPIVTGAMVEAAVVAHLTAPDEVTGGTWLLTALGEIERVQGLTPGSIPGPTDVLTSSDFEKMPEDQLPAVLVITPGLTGEPERDGDGTYTLTWGVGIAAIIADNDQVSTRLVGQVYAAAISLAMTRKPSLGIGARTFFRDERYDDLAFADGRTLGAGRCAFEIRIGNARSWQGGPTRPLPNPTVDPGPWPDVTATSIDVEKTPITEDVRS